MNDLSQKFFWWGIAGLIVLRFILVILMMNNVPFTDMQLGGFRPHFGGSYWPDEVHYFELGQALSKLSIIPNVANLGYPLFLAPIIYWTGAQSPIDISRIIFVVQAFFLFSLAIVLVGKTAFEIFKRTSLAIGAAALFMIYPHLFLGILRLADFSRWLPAFHYQMWILIGADYLSAILVYLGFYLFIKKFNSGQIDLNNFVLLGVVLGAAALVRMANILYLPLILLFLFSFRKWRQSFGLALASFLVYLPQWIYNWYFFGSPFIYGYRIQELSGHGTEAKIFGNWLSFENFISFFESVKTNLPAFLVVLPFLILILILGFWRLFKSQKVIALVLGFWVLLSIGFYLFFVAASSQLRYFIPSIPPLILLFVAGVIKIFHEFRRLI